MVGLDAQAEIPSIFPEPTQSILGGIGDGRPRVSLGVPLGQISADNPTPVQQRVLDISHPQVRYHLAQKVRYFDPATGADKVAPGFETITYKNEKGIIVIDPFSEQTTDIIQPEEFARQTAHSGGVLPLDLATARHTFRENNPIITPMVKEAFHAVDTLIFHGLNVAAVASYDGDLSRSEASTLRGRLNKLLVKSGWDFDPKSKQPRQKWDWKPQYPQIKF
ncbi:MAG: hypothetical protein Q8L37_03775 [Candidatus Gottesmanbacteria bacterium]|nr:hypothetical protein [Candidatus Gottesmanbacteria bacterium]